MKVFIVLGYCGEEGYAPVGAFSSLEAAEQYAGRAGLAGGCRIEEMGLDDRVTHVLRDCWVATVGRHPNRKWGNPGAHKASYMRSPGDDEPAIFDAGDVVTVYSFRSAEEALELVRNIIKEKK